MELSGRREAYPLISRRIGIEQWHLLAQSLDLPVTDLHGMVEGKLRELEWECATGNQGNFRQTTEVRAT